MAITSPVTAGVAGRAAERRVLASTLIGTTIEWYDFFIYAQAAGLVFAQLYFAPLGQQGGAWAQMVSWASLGISFLFRPLGAIIAGHVGDRLGRKGVLIFTLVMMGSATTLIGLLPTYADWGLAAPILLLLLRVLQGLSAGGEWGGAALMAVEHAPVQRRGMFGAYPQIGVPAGMVLATFVVFVVTSMTTDEQFLAWGWRITFLLSLVMILVGYFIRRSVSESPVFEQMAKMKHESASPLRALFRDHWKRVLLAALAHVGSNASGYLLISFFSSYAIRVLGMDQSGVLLSSTLAALFWVAFTLYGGKLSDRIGRTRALKWGYVLMFVWMIPLFLLIDSSNIWLYSVALIGLTVGNGLTYGPLSAMYAEMFPAEVRYSGISIAYALGAVFGGAFAPMLAEALLGSWGSSLSVAVYIMILLVFSFIGTSLIKEPKGTDLRAHAPSE